MDSLAQLNWLQNDSKEISEKKKMVKLWPVNSPKANFIWRCHKQYIFREYDVQKDSYLLGKSRLRMMWKKDIKRGIIASELPDQQRRSGQVRQSLRQETWLSDYLWRTTINLVKLVKYMVWRRQPWKFLGTWLHFLWKHMFYKQYIRNKRYFWSNYTISSPFGPS